MDERFLLCHPSCTALGWSSPTGHSECAYPSPSRPDSGPCCLHSCCVLCSGLPRPPQPSLASSGVHVAPSWLQSTDLSTEPAGISGTLRGMREGRGGGLPGLESTGHSSGARAFASSCRDECGGGGPATSPPLPIFLRGRPGLPALMQKGLPGGQPGWKGSLGFRF